MFGLFRPSHKHRLGNTTHTHIENGQWAMHPTPTFWPTIVIRSSYIVVSCRRGKIRFCVFACVCVCMYVHTRLSQG